MQDSAKEKEPRICLIQYGKSSVPSHHHYHHLNVFYLQYKRRFLFCVHQPYGCSVGTWKFGAVSHLEIQFSNFKWTFPSWGCSTSIHLVDFMNFPSPGSEERWKGEGVRVCGGNPWCNFLLLSPSICPRWRRIKISVTLFSLWFWDLLRPIKITGGGDIGTNLYLV